MTVMAWYRCDRCGAHEECSARHLQPGSNLPEGWGRAFKNGDPRAWELCAACLSPVEHERWRSQRAISDYLVTVEEPNTPPFGPDPVRRAAAVFAVDEGLYWFTEFLRHVHGGRLDVARSAHLRMEVAT